MLEGIADVLVGPLAEYGQVTYLGGLLVALFAEVGDLILSLLDLSLGGFHAGNHYGFAALTFGEALGVAVDFLVVLRHFLLVRFQLLLHARLEFVVLFFAYAGGEAER